MKSRERKIYKVTLIGSIVNMMLLIFKFVAGVIGHSSAMIADAFHSLSDFLSDIVVVVFVRIAGKPEDADHAYGHGKYETLASIIVGIMLFIVGLGLMANGIQNTIDFFNGKQLEMPNYWALSAALLSIVSKEILYHYTIHYGNNLNSAALIANAWHHRSDAFTSVATLLGIGGAMILGDKWIVLDPLAAVVVSVFIVKASFSLMKPGLDELLEKSLPMDEQEAIKKIIETSEGVKAYHHLRTRRVGHNRAVEMHIKLDPDISLKEAHEVATKVENRLKEKYGPDTHVGIHMEPYHS